MKAIVFIPDTSTNLMYLKAGMDLRSEELRETIPSNMCSNKNQSDSNCHHIFHIRKAKVTNNDIHFQDSTNTCSSIKSRWSAHVKMETLLGHSNLVFSFPSRNVKILMRVCSSFSSFIIVTWSNKTHIQTRKKGGGHFKFRAILFTYCNGWHSSQGSNSNLCTKCMSPRLCTLSLSVVCHWLQNYITCSSARYDQLPLVFTCCHSRVPQNGVQRSMMKCSWG